MINKNINASLSTVFGVTPYVPDEKVESDDGEMMIIEDDGSSVSVVRHENALQPVVDESTDILSNDRDVQGALETFKDALSELHEIAKESEKGRDYEVLFNGIKSFVDIKHKLNETATPSSKQTPKTVTNNNTAYFVGTTDELQKIFEEGLKKK